MRGYEVMEILKALSPGEMKGTVSVRVDDLAAWINDLGEAIRLLRGSFGSQGTEWKADRIELLSRYAEQLPH